ncbi:SIS domain-containing protein [Tistrella mobilis]|jgi:D-sedoheptulose 7-phosphate isomerase|uniref:Phosphoheptose isomerase n=1 Tax=Tistrella mobilis TaxID=171437 RepID=A0A162JUI2_9PROT|nr:SIS domain-containing protein [Tistrella mobilis]KYO49907.1 phosphoheptose isomerase [Tistrella mobilis]
MDLDAAFDADAFFDAELEEHAQVAARTRAALKQPFIRWVEMALATIRGGGKIMFFGNGGSASDAQHLATELAVRYRRDRAPIAGLALTTDTSALTAIGNDMGFDQLFARQILALGRPGDMAVGITTSGRSPNVLIGLDAARTAGITTVALTGRDGGDTLSRADLALVVPSETTARIQEMHIMLGQMLCGALEIGLGLVAEEPRA